MAPKYILQFEVHQIMEERNIEVRPEDSFTKHTNRFRYEISKRWRQKVDHANSSEFWILSQVAVDYDWAAI